MMRPQTDPSVTLLNLLPIYEQMGGDFAPLLRRLRELALERNTRVCLVGGPVRDLLLGYPVNDLDFSVVGDAITLAKSLAEEVGATVRVHTRFGTASVSLGNAHIDLVTARRESYPMPGALPVVEPSSLEDDLSRRDFSINAMAILPEEQGPLLLDPTGGRQDLEQGLVRILHANSFRDDPTRLFRALRYEQRFNFALAGETGKEFHRAVESGCLGTVSGDRLRHELERIFTEEFPGRVLVRAVQSGLLPALSPGLYRLEFISRWDTTLSQEAEWNVAEWKVNESLTWLAALAYPLTDGEADVLIARLNMPMVWAKVVRDTLAVREAEEWLSDITFPPSEVCRTLDTLSKEALRLVAGVTESANVASRVREYLTNYQNTGTVLRGTDLIALGIPPGPEVGAVLSILREARLDGEVRSETDERRWVSDLVSNRHFGSGQA